MAYRVVVDEYAARQIRKLPKDVQRRVVARAEALARDPRPVTCKKLEGMDGLYRIRVGAYRIVYRLEHDAWRILIVSVGDRGEVHRRLRRRLRR